MKEQRGKKQTKESKPHSPTATLKTEANITSNSPDHGKHWGF